MGVSLRNRAEKKREAVTILADGTAPQGNTITIKDCANLIIHPHSSQRQAGYCRKALRTMEQNEKVNEIKAYINNTRTNLHQRKAYDLSLSEMVAIRNSLFAESKEKGIEEAVFNAIMLAFNLGLARGIRAERNRKKGHKTV